MRYAADQSRIYLKSDRYLGINEINQSTLSHKRSRDESSKSKQSANLTELRKIIQKSGFQKTSISHYKKEDIIKNKIDISTCTLTDIKAKAKKRENGVDPEKEEDIEEKNEYFFTT